MGSLDLRHKAERNYILLKVKQKQGLANERDNELAQILRDYITIERFHRPLKPTMYKTYYNCSYCGNHLMRTDKYCDNCSQKIDWRFINEEKIKL